MFCIFAVRVGRNQILLLGNNVLIIKVKYQISCMNSPSQSYIKMLLNGHEHYRPYYSVENGTSIGFQINASVMTLFQVTDVCTE